MSIAECKYILAIRICAQNNVRRVPFLIGLLLNHVDRRDPNRQSANQDKMPKDAKICVSVKHRYSVEGTANMSSPLRPTAFSENDINLLRLKEPLVLSLSSPISLSLTPSPPQTNPIHGYALRFSIHLTLISLFETLFFWKFVSKTEDAVLINLINDYTSGFMNACSGLTDSQRAMLRELVDRAINPASVDVAAIAAMQQRDLINNALLQNSWIYFGGLLTTVAGLSAWGIFRRYKTDWPAIVGENLGLVTLLGLYEWMYFSTIILKYQAISMPELDRMVLDNFQASC